MNKEKKFQLAQGDVLFEQIDILPKNLKFEEVKEFCFAYGEISGHRHRVITKEPEQRVWIVKTDEGRFYMKIYGGAEVVHEQHAPQGVKLPEAFYRVSRQFEYTPRKMELVQD